MAETQKPLVIWGATGQALVLAEFAPALGLRVVALIDRDPEVRSTLPGVPIFHGVEGFDRFLAEHGGGGLAGAAAIGGWRGRDRLDVLALMRSRGLGAPALVHPRAWVAADAMVSEGAQVMAGASVATRVRIAEGVIANTGCTIDHECDIGAGAHIAPGAVLAGCVQVGDRAFVGPGAVVLARVRIGAGAIIGAGAVVTTDVPDRVVVYGSPAKVIRAVEDDPGPVQ